MFRYRQFTCERNGSWEVDDLLKTLRTVADCLDKTKAVVHRSGAPIAA